jgi:hypothetical protein
MLTIGRRDPHGKHFIRDLDGNVRLRCCGHLLCGNDRVARCASKLALLKLTTGSVCDASMVVVGNPGHAGHAGDIHG